MEAGLIEGPARDWLEARGPELNARFQRARRRYPRLDAGVVLDRLRDILPVMAGAGEAGSAELLSTLFDLLILHAGRGRLGHDGRGSETGLDVLLNVTFPKLRRLLLTRPRQLPGALSNAVENLGERGAEFARDLAGAAEGLGDAGQLLDAGAVLAWRLGDARLRAPALEIAGRLPPRVVLALLGRPEWPDAAAPLATAALAAEGWRGLDGLFTAQTLAELASASRDRTEAIRRDLAAAPGGPPSTWVLAGRLGDFRGFGGHFDEPPVLLDAGAHGNRHRVWVRASGTAYRIDADVFGWVCRPDPTADFPVAPAPAKPKKRPVKTSLLRALGGGSIEADGAFAELPTLAGATSYIARDSVVAFTRPDSFRVRILAPRGNPR
jgi:hypothetical protein